MKKWFCFLVTLAVLSCLIIGFTGCQSQNYADFSVDASYDKVEKSGTLIVGLDDSFPPMGYVDVNSGELVGFDVDLAKEVTSRLGLSVKFQPIDWATKEMELANGNIDCIWNGMSKTEALDQALNLSFPYMQNNQCILVKADSSYQTLDDLSGNNLCVQTESSAAHALDKNPVFKGTLKNVVEVDTYTKAILELQNGTVDAIGIDEIVARFYIQQTPNAYRLIEAENGKPVSLASEDYVIGFRKNDAALKIKIEQTLTEMANDGTLAKISTKWFGEDVTTVSNQ